MVSTGQMMGYVMAILLPLIAVLIPFYILWKQSSKVERGMLGAIGYGIMGYFWQEIIYSFLGLLALTKMRDVLNATGGNAVVVAFVEALAGSVFCSRIVLGCLFDKHQAAFLVPLNNGRTWFWSWSCASYLWIPALLCDTD